MALAETYRCARALEAIENYARADGPLLEGVEERALASDWPEGISTDQEFWDRMFRHPEQAWDREFGLHGVALSEWVARVPGLFWSEGAKGLRDLAKSAVEHSSRHWITYEPRGKSAIVLGGVGTLRFPPDESGRRLVTLSSGHNASSGIPVLIFPEVWDYYQLGEGHCVSVRAQWQKMALAWAERFPSIRGIPRGYLVLNDPEQVQEIGERTAPTQFHPCTVMEYSKGDAKLFDFVYAVADTRVQRYRKKLENFFSQYKDKKERYGRYLLSADIGAPLWDAEFDSPAALRRAEPGAKAQIDLLEARVHKLSFRGNEIDAIVQLLAHHYNNDSLQRISSYIHVPEAHWFTGGSVADSAVQLLQVCIERNKVEELLDAVARDYPELFQTGE